MVSFSAILVTTLQKLIKRYTWLSNLDSWHSKNLSTHPSRPRPPWPHCAGLSCWHHQGMYMDSCPGIHVPHESMSWFLTFHHIAIPIMYLQFYKWYREFMRGYPLKLGLFVKHILLYSCTIYLDQSELLPILKITHFS